MGLDTEGIGASGEQVAMALDQLRTDWNAGLRVLSEGVPAAEAPAAPVVPADDVQPAPL